MRTATRLSGTRRRLSDMHYKQAHAAYEPTTPPAEIRAANDAQRRQQLLDAPISDIEDLIPVLGENVMKRGMDLRIDKPRPDQLCEKCVASFNPAPMGGPMSLPHYLEEQNHRLRAALNAINEHAKVSSGHEAVQALLLSGALKAEDIA